jgi:hypothetical protein
MAASPLSGGDVDGYSIYIEYGNDRINKLAPFHMRVEEDCESIFISRTVLCASFRFFFPTSKNAHCELIYLDSHA